MVLVRVPAVVSDRVLLHCGIGCGGCPCVVTLRSRLWWLPVCCSTEVPAVVTGRYTVAPAVVAARVLLQWCSAVVAARVLLHCVWVFWPGCGTTVRLSGPRLPRPRDCCPLRLWVRS